MLSHLRTGRSGNARDDLAKRISDIARALFAAR